MSQNQLAQESSPYLKLHADNPVHWRPWGPEAFAEAAAQNKPVLLSVGYTACHWCHVMNHESFADAETAALMNENYINIKVDREERPDIDQLYQTAAQTMGASGGWPLTMFLTPKGEPFFPGTYFPKEERFGQPPFKRVLEDVARIYREQPEPIASTIDRVQQSLANIWARDMRGDLNPQVLDIAAIHIAQRFDIFYGGPTGAPKFPTTTSLELLWRAYLRTGAPQFFQVVQTSLDNMCMGGIYDHVGGGFARYAVDERWLVPHFEKMLYDNAQLVDLLTLVWQHNRNPLYFERIQETLAFVLRDMKVGDAFVSSFDADSEGEEGKFYVWTEAEVDAALAGTFSQRFKQVYNVLRDGNWEGKNILHRIGNAAYPLPEADEALFRRQRELLLAARNKRVAPLRDGKVLADWNGMMIAALAQAGAACNRLDWIEAGIKAFDFVARTMSDGDRLFHSWHEGKTHHTGFADDYAHMARAALVLWEVTQDERFLDRAKAWTEVLNEHFWDLQNGGYFQTADDSEELFFRPRTVFDQAVPSANGTMLTVLGKLHFATADATYRDRSNAVVGAFSGELGRASASMAAYLNGLENIMTGLQIVIVGPRSHNKTQELLAAVHGRSITHRTLLVVDPDDVLPEAHPAFGKTMQNGQPTAYICVRNTCSPAITNAVQLSQSLQLPARPPGQA
ncbi:MAG TPA: thioredoxin domain-containing protein [Rhizomicrobium sp.]|nr:thioredoxin domain-containing protein [Rhizomicrobium sp.]